MRRAWLLVTLELRKTGVELGEICYPSIPSFTLFASFLPHPLPKPGNPPSIEATLAGHKAYPHLLNMVSGVWGVFPVGDGAGTEEGRMTTDGDRGGCPAVRVLFMFMYALTRTIHLFQ